ncbi:hypothetical protein TNCV_3427761 [Trichonephila clavipes]|nr:hypothetical protein TNCV_3427761 [Trichonephila clavipes]
MSHCGFSYTRAFGDSPRNFEGWSSDEDGIPSTNYHTNGRTFEVTTDLTCAASLHEQNCLPRPEVENEIQTRRERRKEAEKAHA